MNRLLFLITFLLFVSACQETDKTYLTKVEDADYLHRSVNKLTDVIVYDIFSPPVASRIYAYPAIAAYETLRMGHTDDYKSLAGQLTDFKAIPQPIEENISFPIASVQAYLTVGKTLIFSEDKITEFENELLGDFKYLGVPKKVQERSIAYGNQVAQHILAWADKDNYKQTRTFPKYNVNSDTWRWIPTPPDYMDGIEPSWSKIRPFVIDSSSQFVPPPPPDYTMDEDSEFYQDVMEVYKAVKDASEDHTAIASFWDCNPYVSHHRGHVMFATKKITPGGHWIGITNIATKKAKSTMMETVAAYALTSIALADGFISCWDEKYRSNLIRPETVINRHIDPDWLPLLQTPPFPEYTSGHSVISSAASVALTSIYGDNFAFIDSTEVAYGLPARSFDSFYDAADEAAISRLYGGIHYMPAITYGVAQGKKVGNYVIDNIQMKKSKMAEK